GGGRLLRRGGRRATQQRADARTQLSPAERLFEIVVRAEVEQLRPLVGAALAGQHQDRGRRRRADPLAHLVPGDLRQLAIEDDEVRRFFGVPPERGLAVVRGDDLVALLAEKRRDHPDERALVVHHENGAQRDAASAVARASGRVKAKTAPPPPSGGAERKSTRLNTSHGSSSYAACWAQQQV